MPHREGAQDALPEGEQLRQHQAAAGGGGVVSVVGARNADRGREEPDTKSITVRTKPGADHA